MNQVREEDLGVELTKRVSWGAIFAGVVTALALALVFSLLGTAIGTGAMDFTQEHDPFKGIAMGAAIWAVVTNIIALFAGGWVAGRLAGRIRRVDHALHGIGTWAVASMFMFFIVTAAAGTAMKGAFGVVSSTANVLGTSVPKVIQAVPVVVSKQKINHTADEVARAVSQASLMGAITLLLSGLAAGAGGLLGAVEGKASYRRRHTGETALRRASA